MGAPGRNTARQCREQREEDTEEAERKNGILFHLCQSRREEDKSQTGSKLERRGEALRVRACVSVCVYERERHIHTERVCV